MGVSGWFGELRLQRVQDVPHLGMDRVAVGLLEDRPEQGRHPGLGRFRNLGRVLLVGGGDHQDTVEVHGHLPACVGCRGAGRLPDVFADVSAGLADRVQCTVPVGGVRAGRVCTVLPK